MRYIGIAWLRYSYAFDQHVIDYRNPFVRSMTSGTFFGDR